MKMINFLLCMSICITILPAENKVTLYSKNNDVKDESVFTINACQPIILLKEISPTIRWSSIDVDYRKLHSKIDYSVWCNMSIPSYLSEHPFIALSSIVKHVDTALKGDAIFREKAQDKYFCLGLIKHIHQRIPQSSMRAISAALDFDAQLKQSWEWQMTHFMAMAELSVLNGESKDSLFGHTTEGFELQKESDGFHTLIAGKKSYSIDLNWTYGSAFESKNILELMIEEGATVAIDLLLATGAFNIEDFMNYDRLCQLNAHPRSISHLVEKYGLTIKK